MRERILGFGGGRRRRRFLLGVVASVAALGVLVITNALAVHDTGRFQLDGDAESSTQPIGPTATDDWDKVCFQVTVTDDLADNGVNDIPDQCAGAGNTTGATAVSWTAEPNTNSTIFTGGGSKDPEDVSSWAWKDGAGGLPDKDNLVHSFAARYSLPEDTVDTDGTLCPADPNDPSLTPKCELLFFGSDRFDNSGDAQQGFWFFQDEITLGDVKSGGGFNFEGVHQNGDLLVISDFSNGGTKSTITVYVWDDTDPDNLKLLETSDDALCSDDLPGGDGFCGIVNPDDGTPAPWAFLDKSGNTDYLNGEFYEGGINLSLLGLGDECFASLASETRSSTSTTATLKDFVLGEFGTCEADMTTQVRRGTSALTDPVAPGQAVFDRATVVGSSSANTPTGTVEFFLCGPIATGACDGTTGRVGTSIGTGTLSGTGATATADSPTVNDSSQTGARGPLAPGRYCFRAEWDGDVNYPDDLVEFDASTECFVVKDTSSITTAQKWLPQDTATVTTQGGTAVAGTVVFSLYENGTCSGTAATTFTDTTAATGGVFETDNGTYRTSPGATISWSATFTPSDTNAVVGSTTTRCEKSVLTIDNSASPFPPTP